MKKSIDFKEAVRRLCEEDKTKYKIIIVDNASIHKSRNLIILWKEKYNA